MANQTIAGRGWRNSRFPSGMATGNARARAALQTAVTASLCAVLAVGPAMAEAPKPSPKIPVASKLTEDQRTLHALNRFTFGPRPGDVQAVEKIGLQKWFELQLDPKKIDDSNLNAMLGKFPAMQLSQRALIDKFPPPQVLRQMARRGDALPSDPVAHAIYENGMASYERQIAAAGLTPQLKAKAPTDNDGTNQMIPAMDATMTPDAAMASTAPRPGARVSLLPKFPRADAVAIVNLPPDERMNKILAMSPDQVAAFRQAIPGPMKLALFAGLSPEQTEVLTALQGPIRVVGAEALETRLLRDVYSDRQLEAVMTDFWLNHFSVYVRKNQNQPYLLPAFERDTIRPHALGKFEDLLVATAESPAMMMYLDNWLSIGPNSKAATRGQRQIKFAPEVKPMQAVPKGINENYARELMELHTIGVRCEVSGMHTVKDLDPSCGNGYTQADVTSVAKVLTGWTMDRPYNGGGQEFEFNDARHEGGEKQVLGVTIRPGGQQEGLVVLHMLATSPATAQFISHKLAVRFVSDNPPRALEDRMAKTFLASGGDIKAVLRTLFAAPEFWSPEVYRAKVKTPIEFVASALRASDAQVGNALPLVQAVERLGMPLYGRQTPDGYPWQAEEWVSTNALVSRMNFALVMSGDLLPGTTTNWPRLLGESAATETVPTAETESQLEQLLLGQAANARTRATVLTEGARPGQAKEAEKNLALASTETGEGGMLPMNGKKKQPYLAGNVASFTQLASNRGEETPAATMAGLLLGSPEFQRR